MPFPRPDSVLRIVQQNVANLPSNAKASKSRQFIDFIRRSQASVFTAQEIGLCIRKLPDEDQWCERVFGRLASSSSSFAYNTTELTNTSVNQPGGVVVISTDEVTHRVIQRGRDPTELGRWSWILLEGKQHHRTRIITAYRPCDSPGPGTVSQQHQRYYHRKHRDDSPRQALLDDLFVEVQGWLHDGDHLVITMDANDDVRLGPVAEFFRSIDMKEAILRRHHGKSPPATQNRNNNRVPIDGIWVTPGLKAVSAGYLPFGEGCPSDHRALWIDLAYEDVFGYKGHPYIPPAIRRLNSRNPRIVEKYRTAVRRELEALGLPLKLRALHTKASRDGWSYSLEEEYNRIHTLQTDIRQKVEHRIRKLRMGEVPWSPKLQIFRDTIELWSSFYKKRCGLKMSNRKIRRLLKQVEVADPNIYVLSTGQVEARMTSAFQAYKEAKKEASSWRNDFLHDLAAARADFNGTTIEHEENAIRKIEQQKRSARNVKRMRGKLKRSATDKVYVTETDPAGGAPVRRCVTEKLDIEAVAARENDSRFSQSENTPPMIEPLLSELGYCGDGSQVENILNGTYAPSPGTDHYAGLLLQEMAMPAAVRNGPKASLNVTMAEHQSGWRKQKETTSSEPHGLTFSHYKVAAQDPVLCEFDTLIRTLPYEYGFSPSLWQNIVDVEILKKAGVYDIEKMRTITLMNAEFQMNNKKIGREVMSCGEAAEAIAPEQTGSRRWHRASFTSLNKRLTNDLFRLQRRAYALGSLDLKSCYDRIVHSIVFLALRRLGASENSIICMLLTLQLAHHRIRTAFGISDETFGGPDRAIPLQGMGQGNGAGPTGWAAVSTPLINMLKTAGFGVHIFSAISKTVLRFLGFAFVDDTDVVHAAPGVNTPGEDVVPEMSALFTHWEGGVKATGGALRPDKSYWYLLDYRWTGSKWVYRKKDEMPGELTVLDANGNVEILRRLDPHEAEMTLGIYLSMDGNFKSQVQYLRETTSAFADSVRTGFLNRADSWYALKTTIMKTLEYPLAAITLTKRQWDYILSPAITATLPRAGFVRTIKRDLVYGPESTMGMEIRHPYVLQFLRQLSAVLHQMQHPTMITPQLMIATLEQVMLEVGIGGMLADIPWEHVREYMTESWWRGLLVYLHEKDIHLHTPVGLLPTNTTKDAFLMSLFIQQGYRKTDLRMLNECRMFLRVVCVSDVVDMAGRRIESWAWYGTPQTVPYGVTDYSWPRSQVSLSAAHWVMWQQALTSTLLSLRGLQVRRPIGKWRADRVSDWKTLYHPATNRLYRQWNDGSWQAFRSLTTRVQRLESRRFVPLAADDLPPLDSVCCTIRSETVNTFITGLGSIDTLSQQVEIDTAYMSLSEALQIVPARWKWAATLLKADDDGRNFAESILRGSAKVTSDGSFKDEAGTSASIAKGSDRSLALVSCNLVPGRPKEQSAYRSELAGVVGSLILVWATCVHHDITEGLVTLRLDGKTALDFSATDEPLDPSQPCFDLLVIIQKLKRRIPVDLAWAWVEGHQDDHLSFLKLGEAAQDNVLCDNIAKAYYTHCQQAKILPVTTILDDEWGVTVAGMPISCLDEEELYAHCWGLTTVDYWKEKFDWTARSVNAVDWDLLNAVFSSLPLKDKRRTVKMASGHLGVGRKMLLWGFQPTDECPRCDAPDETNIHVLCCPDPRACDQWDVSIDALQDTLIEYQTDPEVARAILQGVKRIRSGHPGTFLGREDAARAYVAQTGIGWFPFTMGFATTHWGTIQEAYHASKGIDKPLRRWKREILKKLLNVAWDMWRHRNGILHDTDTSAKQRWNQELSTAVQAQFDLGPTTLAPRHQHWLTDKTLSHILDYEPQLKRQWLESVELARESYDRDTSRAHRRNQAQRNLLRSWLIPPSAG